ncbi:unnamed protein product [Prorocentrum cordatum]|uniref:Solute carrier family 40 protein n=1 Tax=Prorocentrum cordatum TaxID=2364126 RepID=A0ABN9XIE6_9DINO|nr:unnamed protein product [Polarella glacialis]
MLLCQSMLEPSTHLSQNGYGGRPTRGGSFGQGRDVSPDLVCRPVFCRPLPLFPPPPSSARVPRATICACAPPPSRDRPPPPPSWPPTGGPEPAPGPRGAGAGAGRAARCRSRSPGPRSAARGRTASGRRWKLPWRKIAGGTTGRCRRWRRDRSAQRTRSTGPRRSGDERWSCCERRWPSLASREPPRLCPPPPRCPRLRCWYRIREPCMSRLVANRCAYGIQLVSMLLVPQMLPYFRAIGFANAASSLCFGFAASRDRYYAQPTPP